MATQIKEAFTQKAAKCLMFDNAGHIILVPVRIQGVTSLAIREELTNVDAYCAYHGLPGNAEYKGTIQYVSIHWDTDWTTIKAGSHQANHLTIKKLTSRVWVCASVLRNKGA